MNRLGFCLCLLAIITPALPAAKSQQLAVGQQWSCRDARTGGYYDGVKGTAYHAYIPGDNVSGGTPCTYYFGGKPLLFNKHYKADGYPVVDGRPVTPARAFHILNIQNGQYYGGPIHDASQTRAYGAFSPVNGSTLTFADEDGVWWDCFLFHASGYEQDFSTYHEYLVNPFYGQSQVHLDGTTYNPMDNSNATIAWDTNTQINYANEDYVTAYMAVTHICFPAHVVQEQNSVLWHWMPPRNAPDYIFGCLVFHNNMIQGTSWTRQVPCG